MSAGPEIRSIFTKEFSCYFSRSESSYIPHGSCEGLRFKCYLDLLLKYLQSAEDGTASFDNIPSTPLRKLAPVFAYQVNSVRK